MLVELRPAYEWTCEDCGRDNFVRAVVPSLSPEEIEEIREDHGIDDWQPGDWYTRPDSVTCEHCGAEFGVEREDAG